MIFAFLPVEAVGDVSELCVVEVREFVYGGCGEGDAFVGWMLLVLGVWERFRGCAEIVEGSIGILRCLDVSYGSGCGTEILRDVPWTSSKSAVPLMGDGEREMPNMRVWRRKASLSK